MAIELVIKIPEEIYKAVTHVEFDANLVVNEMRKSIASGTPLPKGHGRLIDGDNIDFDSSYFYDCDDVRVVEEIINDAPTIIEADKGE